MVESMKINRLDYTKSLYPHFLDKTDESNFTKHLKVVGKPQYDMRHKLKTVEWARILEKPLQIWKEQTQPYVYDMNFKVSVPFLKEINVYKNPVINSDEEIVSYDSQPIHETFDYENRTNYFRRTLSDIETDIYKYDTVDGEEIPRRRIIPNDTYVLEVFTWDDYHFIKGYPENDYIVMEDNVLSYRYNETFLDVSVEEISYHKYLTFRVHKDKIKQILIRKNDKPIYKQVFIIERIDTNPQLIESCYTYFDDSVTNENTYGMGEYTAHYDIEEDEANFGKMYFPDMEKDEYVFRLPLGDDDFDENGEVKDNYDLEVTTFEKRYRCLHEYDRVYTKRYSGYDNVLGDCFDHDYSLDIIGELLNVKRFRFYQIYRKNDYYFSRTYPTYYNRATEDDYHYMKRIKYYISNYNHIVFPVLEFWKYYHTFPIIRSRKRIVGEMDYSYFRTNDSVDFICDDDPTELIEEEFDEETIVEFSANKATNTEGKAKLISIGNETWYESIIVDNLYIVPNANYRLRFGVKGDTQPVTVRAMYYNRNNVLIKTTPIQYVPHEDSVDGYGVSDEYVYSFVNDKGETVPYDTYVEMPTDAVSVKIILESNALFYFTDATFERRTIVDFDTAYVVTPEDYNSNVYEMYVDYYNIPSNIRIGGSERFGILFKRSLPLTKSGFLFVDLEEETHTSLEASTNITLQLTNILIEDYFEDFELKSSIKVTDFIRENNTYNLSYVMMSNDEIELENMDDEDYFKCTIHYYQGNEPLTTETFEEVYSDTNTYLTHTFITPSNADNLIIEFSQNATVKKESIVLNRTEEINIEEIS